MGERARGQEHAEGRLLIATEASAPAAAVPQIPAPSSRRAGPLQLRASTPTATLRANSAISVAGPSARVISAGSIRRLAIWTATATTPTASTGSAGFDRASVSAAAASVATRPTPLWPPGDASADVPALSWSWRRKIATRPTAVRSAATSAGASI